MSASNYSDCPKCLELFKDRKKKLREEAGRAYGKVSAKEYQNLMDLAEEEGFEEGTLREDYSQGIHGVDLKPVYDVSYHAECSRCHFIFKYEHKEKVIIK